MLEISFFFFSRHYPISTVPDLGFQPLLAKGELIFVAIKISSLWLRYRSLCLGIAAQLRVNERGEEEALLCISSHSSKPTCPLEDGERSKPLPSSGTVAMPMVWFWFFFFGVKDACLQVAPARQMARASMPIWSADSYKRAWSEP